MPDIEAELQFLRAPEAYGDFSHRLECIETHMSWVFLVGDQVYKLKKPICSQVLDFSTVQAREHFCREEVRMNARLAPDVYLGVVALQWCAGRFLLVPDDAAAFDGETVDWLVRMRRLPMHAMLSHRMQSQQVQPVEIDGLVRLLGDFYRHSAVASISPADYLNRFKCAHASHKALLLRPEFGLREAQGATERLGQLLDRCAPDLVHRAERGRVRDGHGDLRPDHVCLLGRPVVIDCLEFNPQLRQLDPFDELSFLAMECAMANAPWIGAQVIAGVAELLDDHPPAALLHFFTAHNALLRATLAASHLLDPQPRTPDKWLPLARSYLQMAVG